MRWILLFVLLILTGCSATPEPAQAPTLAAPSPAATATLPASTATTAPTVTNPPPSATPPVLPRICTPLEGYPIDALAGMTVNPYHPPAPGSDDPHQGIDIAVLMPGTEIAVTGHTVQSALPGRVAAVIRDRFPYGSAVLIETPLDSAAADWWQPLEMPTPAPTLPASGALTCPDGAAYIPANPEQRSLYLLYAHLLEPPALAVETQVSCGQAIGTVGQSGNALAPHLHFEARVGPSGLRMESMAHYDASASAEEMRSYCLWRVSRLFALVDPNRVLALEP